MIRTYLIERRSWLFFFVSMQLLGFFIAVLDPTLSVKGMLYLNLLSSLLFIAFISIRYRKEAPFYRALKESDEQLSDPNSPLEKIVHDFIEAKQLSTEDMIANSEVWLEQEKDEMLRWIHEVKTPMTAMQLIIERIEDPSIKESLRYQWLRVYLLLDQQLHQKRMPFIENDLFIENIFLNDIISAEIKPLYTWCKQKGIGFDLKLAATHVTSDSKWLAFLLRQFITNAIKYSNNHDISIHSYSKANQVKLEISDYGRGIAAKDLPRIFDKGFTSTSHHQDQASTGMGLYLAKKIAASLHIQIEVNSNLGKGTSFTLTFPSKNAWLALTSM